MSTTAAALALQLPRQGAPHSLGVSGGWAAVCMLGSSSSGDLQVQRVARVS